MDAQRDRLTQQEAEQRAGQVSGVSYRVDLDFEAHAKVFRGDVEVEFDHSGGDTFIELCRGEIDSFSVNGVEVEHNRRGTRIPLPAAMLDERNRVRVRYTRPYDRTGEGIHHFNDPEDGAEYLYTQFEPYGAHRLFPCFDQPDLKATYEFVVTAPSDWVVTTATRPEGDEDVGAGRRRRTFARSVPFSTYLASVVAGEYRGVESSHDGIPLGLYARRTLIGHLEKDAGSLFEITGKALDYFSEMFAEPYPFSKVDQMFVPEFNWGGMENVANITYTDNVIFRDPPTIDQIRRRDEYFAHELAHMWFGDLVTMRWWDDVWLNESFASYVAYRALAELGDEDAWQDFHSRMKLWAIREDQLPTTHEIADVVPSTDETFLNFDGITYGKGASSLKQLVRAVGPDVFRDGMRIYFARHRFGNATLADFLGAIQQACDIDLVGWAARWLKTPSLNTIAASVESVGDTITGLELRQSAPNDHPHLRPHHLDIALVGEDGAVTPVPAAIDDVVATVPEAEGLPVPAFVFPNLGDHGYAKFTLDQGSLDFAATGLDRIADPLLRQQVWGSLHEMVRDGELSSLRYLQKIDSQLPRETSIPILQQVTGSAVGVVARFVPDEEIDAAAERFVATARQVIEAAPDGDAAVLWARTLISLALEEDDARYAATLVDDPPSGLKIDQNMRWAVAIRWSTLGLDGAADRVAAELERDPTDRGENRALTAHATTPHADTKREVWERVVGDEYDSLTVLRAAASGFWSRKQRDLLEPYVEPYFAELPRIYDEWFVESAKAFVSVFFPRHRVDDGMRAHIAGVLEADRVGPMLGRLLVEEDDALRRALVCRTVAAADL